MSPAIFLKNRIKNKSLFMLHATSISLCVLVYGHLIS